MEYHGHIPHLSKNQFDVLLMIYASHVDYHFTEDEKSFILKRWSKVDFETMYNLFNSMGDFTCLRTILKYRDLYYPTQAAQEELFSNLKSLFSIDGDFSRMERVFVQFFKKLKNL